MNSEIARLIATGQAQPAIYTGVSANNIIKVPRSAKGIIIYSIKLRAFCDLAAGKLFNDYRNVESRLWHQLRVISEKGTQVFNAKWDIMTAVIPGAQILYLPIGEKNINIWFNSEKDIILELSGIGALQKVMTTTTAALASPSQQNYPSPPFGYGKNGTPGAVATVETIRQTTGAVGNQFEVRSFNDYTPKNIPSDNSFNSMEWPTYALTNLNPPSFNIDFGHLTLPSIEVQYLVYNKQATANFAPPL